MAGGKNAAAKSKVRELPKWRHGRVRHPFPVVDREQYKAPHSDDAVKAAIAKAPEKEVPIAALSSAQHSVWPSRVAQYVDDPKLSQQAGLGVPVVVKNKGWSTIWDGNHRITAAWALGKRTIRAKVADLDVLGDENAASSSSE